MNHVRYNYPAAQRIARAREQRGAVLIVALVLLVIVTLLGISSMSNTQVELRVAANSATSNSLRQGADSLLNQLMRPPPSGARPVHLLTTGSTFDEGPWNDLPGTGQADWPLPADCAAARWRIRQLRPPVGDNAAYLYYEVEADCFAGPDVNGDGTIDEEDGPRSRVVSGMRVAQAS